MLEGGYLLGVSHSGLDARLLTPSLFELALRGTVLYEPALQDRAFLGAAELGLRVLSLRPLLVRLFASALYFEQGGYENSGGELGIGLDLFVGRPWVVTARASGAVLGDSVVSRARVQLGYLFTRYELFVAYEYLRIGSVNLSAPLIGTRLWL